MQPSPKAGGGLPLPASPAESGFLPRREFAAAHHAPSTFALLTLSSQSTVRLSNFPSEFVASFKRALESQSLVRTFREDSAEPICEFVLAAKFWTNPKSVETECLVLELLAILSINGFNLLSTIDYGREPEDKVCLAFSKPPGPIPPSPIFFAISFPSPTLLRVLSPPLHLTPAILQTVRTSWPRGIVSEKKVGDKCYEFKLKGYSFFAEDTFPADSFQHIMSLLKSLDKHSLSLVTSLCLAGGRSRTKDLWIFSGPDSDSPSTSKANVTGGVHYPARNVGIDDRKPDLEYSSNSKLTVPGHNRSATSPSPGLLGSPAQPSGFSPGHSRNVSAPVASPNGEVSTLLRRKRQSTTPPRSPHAVVATLPTVQDKSPAPSRNVSPTPATPTHVVSFTPNRTPGSSGPQTTQHQPPKYTPPAQQGEIIYSTPARVESIAPADSPSTPPLLSQSAFRDSAFSSNTSYDVPIAWTGDKVKRESATRAPGSWKDGMPLPSPTEEGGPRPPLAVKRVDVQVLDSRGPDYDRRSEMALVGRIPPPRAISSKNTPTIVELRTVAPAPGPESTPAEISLTQKDQGQGWVMVNVASTPDQPKADSPKVELTESPISAPDSSSPSSASSTPPPVTPNTVPNSAVTPGSTKSRRWFGKRKPEVVLEELNKSKSNSTRAKRDAMAAGERQGVPGAWRRRQLMPALRSSRRLTID